MDVSGRLDRDPERTGATLPHPGLRLRLVAGWHRWVGLGPWLVPLGVVLTVVGLSSSVVWGAAGAVLLGLGVAASLWHPGLRLRQTRSSHRRSRTRSARKAP